MLPLGLWPALVGLAACAPAARSHPSAMAAPAPSISFSPASRTAPAAILSNGPRVSPSTARPGRRRPVAIRACGSAPPWGPNPERRAPPLPPSRNSSPRPSASPGS